MVEAERKVASNADISNCSRVPSWHQVPRSVIKVQMKTTGTHPWVTAAQTVLELRAADACSVARSLCPQAGCLDWLGYAGIVNLGNDGVALFLCSRSAFF